MNDLDPTLHCTKRTTTSCHFVAARAGRADHHSADVVFTVCEAGIISLSTGHLPEPNPGALPSSVMNGRRLLRVHSGTSNTRALVAVMLFKEISTLWVRPRSTVDDLIAMWDKPAPCAVSLFVPANSLTHLNRCYLISTAAGLPSFLATSGPRCMGPARAEPVIRAATLQPARWLGRDAD